MIDTCLVLAKRPLPGRVKTRLVPPVSAEQAADLAAAALADTLDAVDGAAFAVRVLVLDEPDPGLARPGWTQAPQCHGGLDRRIAHAFTRYGRGSTLLVGMDTPHAAPAQLVDFDPARYDAALGLAADGGWWALGLRDPSLGVRAVLDVPMSTATTGAAQYERLVGLGLTVQVLDELTDVDTVADADLVAAQAPGTRFAQRYTALQPVRLPSV